MQQFRFKSILVITAVTITLTASDSFADEKKPLPEFSQIKSTVKAHFASVKEYKPNDILSVGQVQSVFNKIEKLGWEISDRKDIEGQVLADGDFLVKQLRTKKGTKFMRRIAKLPGGYDRVDRLRKMPYGNRRIRELIAGPDGYKLIQYMTTSQTGLNLGKQLSQGKNGKGFNKPTDRIYTEKDLLKWLQASYEKDFSEAIKKTEFDFQKKSNPALKSRLGSKG